MKSQTDIPPKQTWQQKLVVTLLIPWLCLYYTAIQPINLFFKQLISEQDRSLRYREPTKRKPDYRENFIKHAAALLANTVIYYSIRYRWLIAGVLVAGLTFIIGLLSTIKCIGVWCLVWVGYTALSSLSKGINR